MTYTAIATWPFGMTAVKAAAEVLSGGGGPLEAAVAGAQAVEDDPSVRSVGFAGLPDATGTVTLDACVMDGASLSCGAVAGLQNIRHAAAVALRVMRKTRHVLLVGEGARRFALTEGFREENLLTPESLAEWIRRRPLGPMTADKPLPGLDDAPTPPSPAAATGKPSAPGRAEDHDTVTVLAAAGDGRLGGCCTTSGLAHKLPGRVGDSPIIGAGLYVDDQAGAAGCTGVGEEALRIAAASLMVEAMRAGRSPQAATEAAFARINAVARRRGVAPAHIAFIALSPDGRTGAAATLGTGFDYAVARGPDFTLHRAAEF
jgi:isoaspartyl peptidase/L-asparaginase-like protein (Ntn-hydrolase superfamily)